MIRALVLSLAGGAVLVPNGGVASDRDVACATTNVMSERAICAWDHYRTANRQVIRLINKALFSVEAYEAAMDPDRKGEVRAMLVDGHQAWQTYREETCNLEARLYFGGEGASLAYATCLARLTEARLEDLRVLLEEEGAG
ncbi:MAG: lysozyme inhibitor LprI family protein [Pseudomonadota bacterium]